MQILVFERTAYNIVAGIFRFVARAYDAMITLSRAGTEAGTIDKFPISDVATVMYTIAGVFMLFRVTIAMINMLINPDAINDGKAGAGKLITRIVTSILLLIAFVPNGWIFGDEGILNRVESAMLAPGGLIEKLMPDSIAGAGGDTVDSNSDAADVGNAINDGTSTVKDIAEDAVKNVQNSVAMSGLIDNVYATENTVDCYYFYKKATETHMEQGQEINDTGHSKLRVDGDKGLLHIKFWNYPYDSNSSGNRKALCTKSKDCDKYSYTIITDDRNTYPKDFLSSNKNLYASHYANGWDAVLSESGTPKCPHIITDHYIKGFYDAETGKSNSWETEKSGIVGGWHSQAAMINSLKEAGALVVGSSDTSKAIETALGLQNEKNWTNEALTGDARNPLFGLDNYAEAVGFAQMSMGAFMSCSGDNCEDLKASALVTNGDDIVSAMDNTIDLEFIPAVIAGIGILIWVLVLCVDIIVRRFKLLLLQMIAPIPIISYADPNDQIFDKWKKMYISTYIDLFIKLIAISFAIYLLKMVSGMYEENNELLLKFFYIVAILVFAKMIPSMISDIFGIKVGSGTFKDITGMAKAAAGFGAGAAIGAGAGLITGGAAFHATKGQGVGNRLLAGASAIGSGLTGAARGAGSGSKGNVLGGAKDIAALNNNRRSKYSNGLTPTHLLEAATLGKVGMDYASRADRSVEADVAQRDSMMNLTKHQSKVLDTSRNVGLMKSVQNAKTAGLSIDSNAEEVLNLEYADAMMKASKIENADDRHQFIMDWQREMTEHEDYGNEYSHLFGDGRFAFDWNNNDSFVNGGAVAQMQTEINAFDDELAGSPSMAKVIKDGSGLDRISSVKDVKKATLAAWGPRDSEGRAPAGSINALNDRIREKTIRDPRYNASKGAKVAVGNDKK